MKQKSVQVFPTLPEPVYQRIDHLAKEAGRAAGELEDLTVQKGGLPAAVPLFMF